MILHIDMDAFYASVEQRDRPGLKGVCVIVGGTSRRGVVSTASYEARKFGVHSAMPIFQARKLCPDAVFLTPRMDHYRAVSGQLMEILGAFSPRVEAVSIDEAYLDISGCERSLGAADTIAAEIKRRIKTRIGLTCSVGVAPLKFLAKIASEMNKPDGLFIIHPDEVTGIIEALPIGKAPGVGQKTAGILAGLHIRTLGDVKRYPRETLVRRLGKYGYRLADLAAGIDHGEVCADRVVHSISSEITLSADIDDMDTLCRHLLHQAEDVGRQLRAKGLRAKTITLKVKHADFKQVTRSATLSASTQTADSIYRVATGLLKAYRLTSKIRLIGVGASGLVSRTRPRQMDLFGGNQEENERWEKVEAALDDIDRKFGKGSVQKARLLSKLRD
ncbi:MAG: DNA polymerase IV [Pseudomonadota bacterium]